MPSPQMRGPTLENRMTGVYVENIPHLMGEHWGREIGKTCLGTSELHV